MSERHSFPGIVGIQQRVLPEYRAGFFDHLAGFCEGGLSVFAGLPRIEEAIQTTEQLCQARYVPARNFHLGYGDFYLCYQAGWIAWLDRLNPDILILEANPRYLSNWAAIRWMNRRRRPIIGWGLGAPSERGFISSIRHKYLSAFDSMIAYSTMGAEQYLHCGISPDKIFVAINAVTFPPKELPHRDSIEKGVASVLFVGRLQARKRIDLLLKACAKLHPRPELWIVGEGPERESLQHLAIQVFPEAHFTGAKHGEELDRIFNSADLFVLPGSGGLAVQQAMAHGLPVIVAEGDGTQRDLVHPENGWIVESDEDESLRNALQDALSDPKRLREMGEASYRLVVEKVNIDAMAETFVKVLNTVMGNQV